MRAITYFLLSLIVIMIKIISFIVLIVCISMKFILAIAIIITKELVNIAAI